VLKAEEKYDAIVGDYALDLRNAEEVHRGCIEGFSVGDLD
jgi:hypothetical protein